MRATIDRSMPVAGAFLIASTLLAGCTINLGTDKLSTVEIRTFKVAGLPEIEVETFHGAIEIHSWDKAEVAVEIEKLSMEQSLIDQIKVEATQQGDRIVLKVTGPSRRNFSGLSLGVNISPTARLRVAVPRLSNITARSNDGSIRAEAVDGKIALNTSNGRVTATRLAGDIHVRSGDGSISLDHVTGRLDLETDDGRIGVDGRPSVLRVKTRNGSVHAQIDGDTVMADNWDLASGDGRVTLTLPSAFSAELDAETGDGSVRSSHPLVDDDRGDRRRRERGVSWRDRRRVMLTKIGDGGKTLRVRTANGTIRIEG